MMIGPHNGAVPVSVLQEVVAGHEMEAAESRLGPEVGGQRVPMSSSRRQHRLRLLGPRILPRLPRLLLLARLLPLCPRLPPSARGLRVSARASRLRHLLLVQARPQLRPASTALTWTRTRTRTFLMTTAARPRTHLVRPSRLARPGPCPPAMPRTPARVLASTPTPSTPRTPPRLSHWWSRSLCLTWRRFLECISPPLFTFPPPPPGNFHGSLAVFVTDWPRT